MRARIKDIGNDDTMTMVKQKTRLPNRKHKQFAVYKVSHPNMHGEHYKVKFKLRNTELQPEFVKALIRLYKVYID